MTLFSYDLEIGAAPPSPGEAIARASFETGELTGTWYAITAVRPVRPRRPRPFARWRLVLERQGGPVPEGAWRYCHFPRGLDYEAWWADRIAAEVP